MSARTFWSVTRTSAVTSKLHRSRGICAAATVEVAGIVAADDSDLVGVSGREDPEPLLVLDSHRSISVGHALKDPQRKRRKLRWGRDLAVRIVTVTGVQQPF